MKAQTILIGLAGPAGCGKDTVRGFLEHRHQFAGIALADPMRVMLRELLITNGCDDAYLTKRDLKEVEIPGLGVSARLMMQTLGHEWARKHLAEDFWLRLAATKIAALHGQGFPRVVVSDIRYANEAAWVRYQGGEVWQIDRPGLAPVRSHPSECIHFRVDQVLRNDGTLAQLERATLDSLVSLKRFSCFGREAV